MTLVVWSHALIPMTLVAWFQALTPMALVAWPQALTHMTLVPWFQALIPSIIKMLKDCLKHPHGSSALDLIHSNIQVLDTKLTVHPAIGLFDHMVVITYQTRSAPRLQQAILQSVQRWVINVNSKMTLWQSPSQGWSTGGGDPTPLSHRKTFLGVHYEWFLPKLWWFLWSITPLACGDKVLDALVLSFLQHEPQLSRLFPQPPLLPCYQFAQWDR